MIANGYPMGIPRQVMQDMFGTAEGRFDIHHPVFPKERPEEAAEALRFGQVLQMTVEAKRSLLKGKVECVQKLAAKHPTQHAIGKKEARLGGLPARVVEAQTPGRDDAMHMRMTSVSGRSAVRAPGSCVLRWAVCLLASIRSGGRS
jgi:hypothetical protein